jgi:hypothetical protein
LSDTKLWTLAWREADQPPEFCQPAIDDGSNLDKCTFRASIARVQHCIQFNIMPSRCEFHPAGQFRVVAGKKAADAGLCA